MVCTTCIMIVMCHWLGILFFCFLCKNWHFCPLSEFFFRVDMLISFAFCFNWKITIFLLISINEILVITKKALLNQLTVGLINKSVIFRNCVSTILRLIIPDAMFLVSMSISSSCFGSNLLWIFRSLFSLEGLAYLDLPPSIH